jgi:hypothetical protein
MTAATRSNAEWIASEIILEAARSDAYDHFKKRDKNSGYYGSRRDIFLFVSVIFFIHIIFFLSKTEVI